MEAPSTLLADLRTYLSENDLGRAAFLLTCFCLAVIFLTRFYSGLAYRYAITTSRTELKDAVAPSPLLPYWVPWIGHSLHFFWKSPNRWYPRDRSPPPQGIYSMLLAGRRTHIVTNATAIRYLFRHSYTNGLSREAFVRDLLVKCLQVTPHDTSVINTGKGRRQQEEVFHKYLARREAVAELTLIFSKKLHLLYRDIVHEDHALEHIGLYSWLRSRIFATSLSAFFGDELLKIYPKICKDIFHFDEDMTTFFFDMPRILNRTAWHRRQRMLEKLARWDATVHQWAKGARKDPGTSSSWDPVLGSRFCRARQRFYEKFGLCSQSRAGMNLSIMFALASNVIPAIGWMLFHILAGPDSWRLRSLVQEEVNNATRSDDTLDVRTLLSSSPLLQSIWTEVLRHYCDNMIVREVNEDVVIPVDEQGCKSIVMKKGESIISPCWVPHHDAANWQNGASEPSPEVFYAERFVGEDLSHAKTSALGGVSTAKMYPFGGGKSICAGRIFAKEEAIVTVAQTLLSFDIEVNGFLDDGGKPTSSFPTLTPALPGVVIYSPRGDVSATLRKRVYSL